MYFLGHFWPCDFSNVTHPPSTLGKKNIWAFYLEILFSFQVIKILFQSVVVQLESTLIPFAANSVCLQRIEFVIKIQRIWRPCVADIYSSKQWLSDGESQAGESLDLSAYWTCNNTDPKCFSNHWNDEASIFKEEKKNVMTLPLREYGFYDVSKRESSQLWCTGNSAITHWICVYIQTKEGELWHEAETDEASAQVP